MNHLLKMNDLTREELYHILDEVLCGMDPLRP